MLNLLIADDNIEYVKSISNLILYKNEKIRLVKIANNANETLKYIKECRIDIILLDLIMPNGNGLKVLDKLNEITDYDGKPKVIIVSTDTELVNKLKNQYDVLDVIYKQLGMEKAIKIINKNINELESLRNIDVYKRIVYKELTNLKYNIKHNGTKYIMESILFVINNKKYEIMLNNLEKNVYPIIAHRFGKSVGNIKNNIVKATNNMYNECNIEYLLEYFEYEYDTKPTPKMVIMTIVNKLLENKS